MDEVHAYPHLIGGGSDQDPHTLTYMSFSRDLTISYRLVRARALPVGDNDLLGCLKIFSDNNRTYIDQINFRDELAL